MLIRLKKVLHGDDQRGGTMMEAVMMLGLMAMTTPILVQQTAKRSGEIDDVNLANEMRTVHAAMDGYIQLHYPEIKACFDLDMTNVVTFDVPGSPCNNRPWQTNRVGGTTDYKFSISIDDLIADGFLMQNFNAHNSADQSYHLAVVGTPVPPLSESTACLYTDNNGLDDGAPGVDDDLNVNFQQCAMRVEGLVLTQPNTITGQPNGLPSRTLARIATMVGPGGGMYIKEMRDEDEDTVPYEPMLVGANGVWASEVENFVELTVDPIAAPYDAAGDDTGEQFGYMAAVTSFAQAGSSGDFLYRVEVPGNPAANQMRTDLDMTGNAIANIGGNTTFVDPNGNNNTVTFGDGDATETSNVTFMDDADVNMQGDVTFSNAGGPNNVVTFGDGNVGNGWTDLRMMDDSTLDVMAGSAIRVNNTALIEMQSGSRIDMSMGSRIDLAQNSSMTMNSGSRIEASAGSAITGELTVGGNQGWGRLEIGDPGGSGAGGRLHVNDGASQFITDGGQFIVDDGGFMNARSGAWVTFEGGSVVTHQNGAVSQHNPGSRVDYEDNSLSYWKNGSDVIFDGTTISMDEGTAGSRQATSVDFGSGGTPYNASGDVFVEFHTDSRVTSHTHLAMVDNASLLDFDTQGAKGNEPDGTPAGLAYDAGSYEAWKATPEERPFLVDPGSVSRMHDIRIAARGNARLSDLLPNLILKDSVKMLNTVRAGKGPIYNINYDEGEDECGTLALPADPYMGMLVKPSCYDYNEKVKHSDDSGVSYNGHYVPVITVTPTRFKNKTYAGGKTSITTKYMTIKPGAGLYIEVDDIAVSGWGESPNRYDDLDSGATPYGGWAIYAGTNVWASKETGTAGNWEEWDFPHACGGENTNSSFITEYLRGYFPDPTYHLGYSPEDAGRWFGVGESHGQWSEGVSSADRGWVIDYPSVGGLTVISAGNVEDRECAIHATKPLYHDVYIKSPWNKPVWTDRIKDASGGWTISDVGRPLPYRWAEYHPPYCGDIEVLVQTYCKWCPKGSGDPDCAESEIPF